MDRTLLAELAYRFLEGTATEEEKTLLHQWFDTADKEAIELVFLPERETEEDVKKRIFAGLQGAIAEEAVEPDGLAVVGAGAVEPDVAPVVALPPRRIGRYTRWIAAASILVVAGVTGFYFWNAHKADKAACCEVTVAAVRKDLPPGGNKATLLLGDGTTVNLGAVQNGVIRQVAGTRIDKQDGKLVYYVATNAETAGAAKAGAAGEMKAGASGEMKAAVAEMNTIQTPRGGQYQVVLPDGTRVWLNAASSLTYPTVFTGPDRRVQLNGEAYFEVAGKKDRPFLVAAGNMQVNVLGTHFNLMAYDDENAIKTTLLEGAVKVTRGDASYVLQPGQQASLDRGSGVFKLLAVNVDEVVAWKNGVFELGGETIEPVMREMARWYDVDVEYQGKTNEHFRGTIPRSANASEVFKMLELTGAVHFTIEGKKVIVRP